MTVDEAMEQATRVLAAYTGDEIMNGALGENGQAAIVLTSEVRRMRAHLLNAEAFLERAQEDIMARDGAIDLLREENAELRKTHGSVGHLLDAIERLERDNVRLMANDALRAANERVEDKQLAYDAALLKARAGK